MKICIVFFALGLGLIILVGCARPQIVGTHDYTVSVVNQAGNPIEGVSITGYSLNRAHKHKVSEIQNKIECKTSKKGLCVFNVEANLAYYVGNPYCVKKVLSGNTDSCYAPNWKWGFASAILVNAEHVNYFTSTINRYFSSYDVERNDYTTMSAISVPDKLEIKLIPLKDLLCKLSLNSKKDIEKAHKDIAITLSLVREPANKAGFHLENINVISYKNKDFIGINIDYPVAYNSEKSTQYENVRDVVDRVIRGVVGAMDINFNDWCIAGYNIKVHAERYSFIKGLSNADDPSRESLNLDVYMQKDIVHKYKLHEITGQSLIDSSVVLLNNERIDVKMQ